METKKLSFLGFERPLVRPVFFCCCCLFVVFFNPSSKSEVGIQYGRSYRYMIKVNIMLVYSLQKCITNAGNGCFYSSWEASVSNYYDETKVHMFLLDVRTFRT